MKYKKYEDMKTEGITPSEAYILSKNDGLATLDRMKMLRLVYGLSMEEVKKVTNEVDKDTNISVDEIEDALQEMDE